MKSRKNCWMVPVLLAVIACGFMTVNAIRPNVPVSGSFETMMDADAIGASSLWASTRVVSTDSTRDSERPSLTMDDVGNIHVAWQDYTNYSGSGTDVDIFYSMRNATTGTWSTTEVVSTNSTENSYYPSLAMYGAGTVHVAWYEQTGTDIDILYSMRNATTGKWSTTEMISTNSTDNSYCPSLAVDDTGNVHVAWHDSTNYKGSGTDIDIFYSMRNATTGTWNTTEVVSTNRTDNSQRSSLAVGGAGTVHVAWHEQEGTDVDIFYSMRNATTGKWSTPVNVSTNGTDPSYFPSLAMDDAGNVHVAWHDFTNYNVSGTDADIFYSMRNATTGKWSTTEVISTNSTFNSYYPSLVMDSTSTVHVAWQEQTGTDIDIFYSMRNATTGKWSTRVKVSTDSTGDSEWPSLAMDDAGNVHVAWYDDTNYSGSGNDSDIFYKIKYSSLAIELTSPLNNSLVMPDGTIVLAIYNDTDIDAWYNWDGGNDTAFAVPYNITYPGTSPSHVLNVHANDTGGNVTTASYTFFTDYIPNASFSANVTSTYKYVDVLFNHTGDPGNGNLSYNWSFGDDNYSNSSTPIHSFNADDNFNVTLTVVDGDGDSDTCNMTIEVVNRSPVANFTYSPASIEIHDLVQFTFTGDLGDAGDPSPEFQWNFGDDSANTTEHDPVHQFSSPGTFNVTLTITDTDGDAHTRTITITVNPGTEGTNIVAGIQQREWEVAGFFTAAFAFVAGFVLNHENSKRKKRDEREGTKTAWSVLKRGLSLALYSVIFIAGCYVVFLLVDFPDAFFTYANLIKYLTP